VKLILFIDFQSCVIYIYIYLYKKKKKRFCFRGITYSLSEHTKSSFKLQPRTHQQEHFLPEPHKRHLKIKIKTKNIKNIILGSEMYGGFEKSVTKIK
jgi:hypothetical protein